MAVEGIQIDVGVSILPLIAEGRNTKLMPRVTGARVFQSSPLIAEGRNGSRATGGIHGNFGALNANRRSNLLPCFHWLPNRLAPS